MGPPKIAAGRLLAFNSQLRPFQSPLYYRGMAMPRAQTLAAESDPDYVCRAAPRNLLGAGRPAGPVIQAIRHLRERGLEAAQLERLRKRLDGHNQAELSALTPKLPAWMRPIVQNLTERAKS